MTVDLHGTTMKLERPDRLYTAPAVLFAFVLGYNYVNCIGH